MPLPHLIPVHLSPPPRRVPAFDFERLTRFMSYVFIVSLI